MTDYNDGRWHGWNGGECTVHPESVVEVVRKNKQTGSLVLYTGQAGKTNSNSGISLGLQEFIDLPIVAFRVTEQYVEPKKPREWWILQGKIYGYNCDPSAIHVREVLE